MMKKYIVKSVLILIIPVIYIVIVSAFSKNTDESKGRINSDEQINFDVPKERNISGGHINVDTPKFVNMIMNIDHWNCDSIWIFNHLDKYRESLGYNAVQVYPSDDYEYGRIAEPLNDFQKGKNKQLIDSVNARGMKFFYEHVFFSYLCYAQQIVFEVPGIGGALTNNGFCYRYSNVAPTADSGRTVLFEPQSSNHNETLIVSSIYENLQQSDKFGRQNDDSTWFLRPMVRARIDNSLNGETPIFKIRVIKFNNQDDTTFIIKAKNFRKQGYYSGEYIDKFYSDQIPIELPISGNKTSGLNQGRHDNLDNLYDDNVDFKIYTYGYVDFWFDKLTVEDVYAHKLFDTDTQNNFDSKISDELEHIGGLENFYSYYMDEVTYSQLPCIKYVMDKITAFNSNHSKDIKFLVSGSNWMAVNKMRNKTLGYKITLDWLKPRIFNGFAYELFGDYNGQTFIPAYALKSGDIDTRLPDAWKTNIYDNYNNYLQNIILGSGSSGSGGGIHDPGTYIYQVSILKQAIKDYSPNTILFFTPQMQGEMWFDSQHPNYLVGMREPLNEEIEAQTMTALAHGINGITGYIFQTAIDSTKLFTPVSHVFGLYGWVNGAVNNYMRVKNLYGQDKWNYIKKMNAKINSWIPTLDVIYWTDGYSVHNEGAGHNYIQDIKSILFHQDGSISNCKDGNVYKDCDNKRYWEMGFFNSIDSTDKSKYFLMVNRRCTPEIAGIDKGDLRYLHIKFNPSELTGYNKWNLYDVSTSKLLTTFDKNLSNFIQISQVFQPGEGRLFRLSPVVEEGMKQNMDESSIDMSLIFYLALNFYLS